MNSVELASLVGVSRSVLRGWQHSGYLRPRRVVTETGRALFFPPVEVDIARKMAFLTRVGFNPRAAHDVARQAPDVMAALAEALDSAAMFESVRLGNQIGAEQAVVDAMDAAVAVRDVDPREVWAALEVWLRDSPRRLLATVMALAAMVPVETPVSELLAWTDALDARGAA